jgi:hypothetical protein
MCAFFIILSSSQTAKNSKIPLKAQRGFKKMFESLFSNRSGKIRKIGQLITEFYVNLCFVCGLKAKQQMRYCTMKKHHLTKT